MAAEPATDKAAAAVGDRRRLMPVRRARFNRSVCRHTSRADERIYSRSGVRRIRHGPGHFGIAVFPIRGTPSQRPPGSCVRLPIVGLNNNSACALVSWRVFPSRIARSGTSNDTVALLVLALTFCDGVAGLRINEERKT